MAPLQGVGKWFEGAQGQSVYWAVSNDSGLTWGPTQVMIPSPDTLPLWGPVVHTQVITGLPQHTRPVSPGWRLRLAGTLICKRIFDSWLCAAMQGGMCMAVCLCTSVSLTIRTRQESQQVAQAALVSWISCVRL